MAQANVKAVITADDRASSTIAGVGNSFGKLSSAMAIGQLAATAVTRAFDQLVSVGKQSVGMAFDQVRQVENATIALRAYEKDGNKVNAVLKDLISYARSDMGVLFQREDLFAAAQTLKLYGQTTETLTDKVKILSKGVSLGKTTFQELSSIVGRAAAKGRLDAVDFDMLIERGIGLDKSFRGATVTSEQLFDALDKALPAELLKGRANTIDGLMIRLKSAFRDVGSAILGVNTETSQFIQGGLGDQFTQWIRKLTEFLKSPQFKEALNNIVTWLSTNLPLALNWLNNEGLPFLKSAFDALLPVLQALFEIFKSLIGFINDHQFVLRDLIALFIAVKAAMFLEGALAAFQGVMAGVTTAYRGMATVVSGPISLVLLAGAALAVLELVYQKFLQTKADMENTEKSIQSSNRAREDAIQGLNAIAKGRAPGNAEAARNTLKSWGVPGYAMGGFTGRGDTGDFAGVVHKGEYVVPKSQVDQTTGTPKGAGVVVNVNAGAFMGSQQDARRYAQQIADALKDIAKMNGTTVGSMLA